MQLNGRDSSTCYHCKRTFDPVTSKWCDCLSELRSLVCPTCGRCSCAAPTEWSRVFGVRMPRPGRAQCAPENATWKPIALVAEDQPIARTMICAALSGRFDVILAASGTEALELARKFRPALVVTDGLMPGMDGRELTRSIKADTVLAATKVILVTALYKGTRHVNDAVLRYGVDSVLAKPVTRARLLEEVERLLGPAAAIPCAQPIPA